MPMLVYGLLVGAVLVAAGLLLVRLVVAAWRRFWSLDRRWCRLEKAKGSVKAAKQLFMKLADGFNYGDIEAAANRLIRNIVAECSFFGHIIPIEDITTADLDRQVGTDALIKVVDRVLPSGHTARNRVLFDRVMTPRFVKDIDELRVSYDDPRVIFRMLGTGLAHELDARFITVVNRLLCSAGKIVPESGVIQWFVLYGGITRSSIMEAFRRFAHLWKLAAPDVVLINTNMLRDILLLSRRGDNEEIKPGVYDDLVEKGVRWVVTDKCDLVPDGAMYMFGPHKKLGRTFRLDRASLHFDRRAYDLQFFAHMLLGNVIFCSENIARVDFTCSRGADQIGEAETLSQAK